MKGLNTQNMQINIVNNIENLSENEVNSIENLTSKLSAAIMNDKYINQALIHGLKDSYLTVSLVSPDEIKEINNEARNIDKVTDCLSFPILDLKDGEGEVSPFDFERDSDGNIIMNLGDILICLEQAKKQADEYGHSEDREISFLIGHSMLHLLGYDHIEDGDREVMEYKQKQLMADIGLAFDDELAEITDHKEDDINSNIAYPAGTPCDHCGYVAIIGRPNVGKSTFINYITGMKVAIVSHKPQTTRTNIRSIYNTDDSQIIFTDTPGVHTPKSKLQQIMVDNSFNSAKNADVVLFIVDGRFQTPGNIEKRLMELCKENNKKVILAINKTDDISKEDLLPMISKYSQLFTFDDVIPMSAKTGYHVDLLLEELSKRLPAGPRLFDSEYMTDQTEREISKELIREQLLHYTDQEIPHGTAVEITKFEERYADDSKDEYDRSMVVVEANIICERNSHKAIIIGKDGQMIKRIGTKARHNIERLVGCKVFLDLFVKVREDWKNNDNLLKEFGYHTEEDN